MENFTSTPFSMRDSGSAFINQYERPDVDSSELSSSSSSDLASTDSDFCFLGFVAEAGVPFVPRDFRGRPTGRGVAGLAGVTGLVSPTITSHRGPREVTISQTNSAAPSVSNSVKKEGKGKTDFAHSGPYEDGLDRDPARAEDENREGTFLGDLSFSSPR